MDGSPQSPSGYISLWDADKQQAKEARARPEWIDAILQRFRPVAAASVQINARIRNIAQQGAQRVRAASPRALAVWQAAQPVLLSHAGKLLSYLPNADAAHDSTKPTPVQILLTEFEKLESVQQDRVAKNLVLLWDNFQSMFGGISGFLSAPETEQNTFMERLKAAAERMETARGSDAAFHFVTVELMRQYISFLQTGRADTQALSLATCVVSLIDRGRTMASEPMAYSIKS